MGASDRHRARQALVTLALASALVPAAMAQQRAVGGIALQIPPEARLNVSTTSVDVLIRLRPGATAMLWTSDDCSANPGSAGQKLAASGNYSLLLPSLGTQQRFVCMSTSDRSLRSSVPLPRPAALEP